MIDDNNNINNLQLFSMINHKSIKFIDSIEKYLHDLPCKIIDLNQCRLFDCLNFRLSWTIFIVFSRFIVVISFI